ncbi:MAG: AmmeMemoRadiSam system radical SAM enzyme [Lachnospiraceae bacterium]|nr:AmmeMemoRadiSam system radical SAM enzyme [Lachnospiraceae bacterium]
MKAECSVCFRHCRLEEGQTGACFARKNENGKVISENYGKLTAIALDPIEKKPLRRFYPGSRILSVGSYGCNLKCPFCQNVDISLADGEELFEPVRQVSPEELSDISAAHQKEGNIGVAFTYNEPLIGFEFVRDTARLIHERGMKNVLVTNGCASLSVFEEIAPFIDAMNIDLKCFQREYYEKTLQGDFEMVKAFIREAVRVCHVEITTLVVPWDNDEEEEMRTLFSWLQDVGREAGKEIPLHLTRFFPRSRYAHRKPTDVKRVYELAEMAREYLQYVYEGNC